MKFSKTWLLGLAAVSLSAGCMQLAEIETPPQSVTFTSKQAQDNAAGFSQMAVRSFVSTEKGRKDDQEMLGARCSVKGRGFKADVVTPALIKMPIYTGASSPADISCRTDKDRASTTVKPFNATLARINATQSSGGGLLGVVVTAAVKGMATAARDPLKDEFNYPGMARVVFGVGDE
ncbi:MAG: hypothetical protein N4A53_01710 [Pelagimonas sp.]|jgi:hypothetical protein|nr:hypothetical protein [Pelagimonas sp.]